MWLEFNLTNLIELVDYCSLILLIVYSRKIFIYHAFAYHISIKKLFTSDRVSIPLRYIIIIVR